MQRNYYKRQDYSQKNITNNTAKMMPQPPHHKEEQPRGLTDQTVDAAHDFMEHAEEDLDKVRSARRPFTAIPFLYN